MIFLKIFCSSINWFNWLQNHLIPCPLKFLTGIDCPGCGFQRSFIALVQGDFAKSWSLYPPTVPLLLMFSAVGLFYLFPFKKRDFVIRILFLLVGNFTLLVYIHKMWMH
ncbi:DUF2752 domain-containing protein [Pedobacter sp. MW01-1-1]|uniref:DUF2752 domain-containing protein n=1 Tax=Pedobacter sp. MW01-1-1 TaxID=3383027 RepID=UPI003FED59D4